MAPGRRNLKLKHPNNKVSCDRRSSLQVNLSFEISLSDSGNGSLKCQQDNNKVASPNSVFRNHSNSMLNIIENSESRRAENMQSIVESKEQELSKNCQILKDAIIQKTREIFDGHAEFTVKTANVLTGQREALKEINNGCGSVGSLERPLLPTNCSAQSSSSLKCSTAPINSNSNAKSILLPVARISKGDASIILSGSNKSHRKTLSTVNEKVLRVSLTRIPDPGPELPSTSPRSSQSSIQSSIPEDIGAPITCSSFISDHGNRGSQASQRSESETAESSENPDVEESAVPSALTLTPVEITAVEVPLSLSDKRARLRKVSGNAETRLETTVDRSSRSAVPMELTTVQSHVPLLGDSTNSVNTVRTWLNVNTSTNDLLGGWKKRTFEEVPSVGSNSASRLSLRVNTSLGTEERSPVRKTVNSGDEKIGTSMKKRNERIVDDSSGSDTDATENMSLIARLRNISGKKTTEKENRRNLNGTARSSLTDGPSFIESTPYPPSRSILWRTQLKSATLKTIRNRPRRKTPTPVAPTKSSSDSDSSRSAEYLTPPNTTVVLGDSPCRFTATCGNTQIIPDSSDEDEAVREPTSSVTTSEVPPEEPSKERSDEPSRDHWGKSATASRPGKKKLLPLNEDLQLVSFSPVSPAVASPKRAIVGKKRIRKRKVVQAVAAKRIESASEEDEDDRMLTADKMLAERETKKKTAKPRKIISKKIVVKKIVGTDVLQEWEHLRRVDSDKDTNSRRSSLNDFSKKKILSISGRSTRRAKLVIVATGFTKGDVDLVKSVAKELGGAEVSSTVTRRTTHVVSTGVRTINLLRGIIRGCWLVSLEWVLESLEQGRWLNAQRFEMAHFSKAVQENRRDRQLFGKFYVPELFATCGPIYIERGTTPPSNILKELVKTAGGRIAENAADTRLSVGPDSLREIWILDSITTGDLQPIQHYQRK